MQIGWIKVYLEEDALKPNGFYTLLGVSCVLAFWIIGTTVKIFASLAIATKL